MKLKLAKGSLYNTSMYLFHCTLYHMTMTTCVTSLDHNLCRQYKSIQEMLMYKLSYQLA